MAIDEDYTKEDFTDGNLTNSESTVSCTQCFKEIGCCKICEDIIYGECSIYCKDSTHYHEDCINEHFEEDEE